MKAVTYKFKLRIPQRIAGKSGSHVSREVFFSWLWENGSAHGLLGVHEGTLLSEKAAEEGKETESWTLDAAEAPRERDWVGDGAVTATELYFGNPEGAKAAARLIEKSFDLKAEPLEEQPEEDWDAQWKASFLGSPDGVKIPPCWRVVPPWHTKPGDGEILLKINPGAGFGTGTHETTQLCLQALAERNASKSMKGVSVLDFGSGSGILSIGAALLGGVVDGVEIDPLAIDNATENAKLNQVEKQIHFSLRFPSKNTYDVVLANILRPVLLEFASEVCRRLKPEGTLILSGLVEGDVSSVSEKYSSILKDHRVSLTERGEWRALVWRPKR